MTEEINQETREEKKCKCLCCSEGFRDFLKIALGSFVGVFFALTLFAALHKPPMPPCHGHHFMKPPIHQGFQMNRGCPFQKMKMEKRNFDRQVPVRVEVEPGR